MDTELYNLFHFQLNTYEDTRHSTDNIVSKARASQVLHSDYPETTLISRFMVIINVIKKKSYDLLDHRKMDFDTDYDDFCNQVGDVESEIQRFMEESLDKPSTTQAALQLVKKYQSEFYMCNYLEHGVS